ncbi:MULTISPECIES: YccJ family protein [unclassified Gilliamella]|uniref:YccJ family protein n=1 Tax=unclassified Gilliamella TaxID=2685620 RepID=UPI001C6A2E3A|nr:MULTISPECIES: YccJ family protein [unclassified Gilliamella]MCX8601349.1 YccJ family protein [Gilliamella sp. B3722]MCX8608704.1 YccJ family protein [Gilliamella sp. B3771]MCX8610681.1 YccJ family protein [Gilliamella sp. B3891]MCX8613080.1 YccJ family protein [Gilliamella sp. B3773]MCX8615423.1 YccJ family protein [Gilliamella sp. B3770]
MNSTKKEIHDIRSWASIRETSIEIAEAIFELANYDEKLAEQIWSEGSDEVLPLAFSKTKADKLFWGEQTIERKNI